MIQVWQALLWKEWREHRGKMLALAAILIAVVVGSNPLRPRDWLAAALPMSIMLGGAGGIFIGLGVAAGENSRRTRGFIETLPRSLQWLAGIKLLMGGLAAIVPVLLVVGVLWGTIQWIDPELLRHRFAEPGEPLMGGFSNYYLGVLAIGTATSLSLYLWTIALAVNAVDEIRAAAWSIGSLLAYALVCIWLAQLTASQRTAQEVVQALTSFGPLGFLTDISDAGVIPWLRLSASTAAHLGLVAWFICRFGRPRPVPLDAAKPAAAAPSIADWLSSPRRSPWSARVWKLVRESGPIIGCGLMGAVGLSVFITLMDRAQGSHQDIATDLAQRAGFCLVFFGFLVSVVCGIGVVWSDVQPGVNTFWRAQPVSPDAWFASKYLGNAAMLLVAFGAPQLVAAALARQAAAPHDDWSIIVPIWICGLLAFSLAVLFATMLRHAVYASLLSMGGGVGAASLLQEHRLEWLPVETRLLVILALGVAASLAAWWAFRRDWAVRW